MCSSTSCQWLNWAGPVSVCHQAVCCTHKSKCLCSLGPLRAIEQEKEGALPGFRDVPALNEKGFVSSHIKPQITKPGGSGRSLFTNSFLSAYEKPSPQAVDLRQGTE